VAQLTRLGSYFPAQKGVTPPEGEWPLGDEATWKNALKANEVDEDDVQGVASTVVKHVTTTLARQAFNLNDVSSYQQDLTDDSARCVSGYCPVCPRPAHQALERDHWLPHRSRPKEDLLSVH
jgi:hypothetical protein